MPVPASVRGQLGGSGHKKHSRLNVLVGLSLLCPLPLPVGMPSRIPFSSPNAMLLRRGNGRLESGPASPWSASNELRLAILIARGEDTNPEEDGRWGTERSSSAGECGGELKMPGG